MYELRGKELWRNGILHTDNIEYIGGMTNNSHIYEGTPRVGDMLYIEYRRSEELARSIRTSTVTEVIE
jgi:hypothetical protein